MPPAVEYRLASLGLGFVDLAEMGYVGGADNNEALDRL